MLRSSTLLLSVLGLTFAASTIACSGHSAGNGDVDSSLQAVKRQDGTSTGNGKTCSWSGVTTSTPPSTTVSTPPSGGSSGGCNTDADGQYRCWSYDANGNKTTLPTKGAQGDGEPIPEESSSGWSSSSGGSSSGSSSGGCKTDEKGNTECWTDPSPTPEPPVRPTPMPTPTPEQTFQLGEWFPALDGCNKCTCTDIGIMCTVQACVDPTPPPPSKGCVVDGKYLEPGTSFKSADGCNSCGCSADGSIACTEMACVDPRPEPPVMPPPSKGCEVYGKWLESGTEYKDDCNSCTCKDGQKYCTEIACAPKK